MATVSALARVDIEQRSTAIQSIERMPGASTFDVGDTERVGVLLDGITPDQSCQCLTQVVESIPDVLATWPTIVGAEDDLEADAAVACTHPMR